jgi:3-oxoacyl-[acyl-carrier-protein] synthase II
MLVCVQAVREGLIPPTLNCERPEPGLEVDLVRDQPRKAAVSVALSNSFGFGGHNAVLVVGPPPE